MTTLFYTNRRLLLLGIMLIVVAGMSAYSVLPRMEDPRFTNRYGNVVTRLPGASAERVEALVTEKIEDELQKIEQVRKLTSASRLGISVVQVELDDAVGPDEVENVWSRVRDRVADVEAFLPKESSKPIFNNDDSFAFTILVAVTWPTDLPYSHAIVNRRADELEDRLLAVAGTEHTELFGSTREEIRVQVNQQELAALGLAAQDIARQTVRSDAKVAAGQLRSDANDLLIEVTGELDTVERIANISIARGDGGQFVRLGDIATIEKAVKTPVSERAIIDGVPGVVVGARMSPDFRIDQWAGNALKAVDAFRSDMAGGLDVQVIFDQNNYTESRLQQLTSNFLLGIGAIILVMVVMMGWRAAVLVAIALPLSSLMVIAAMRFLGIPIHQMSITGLIIALGLLIDNAIVMVDDVRHRLRDGATTTSAINKSVRHLAVPLLGSTLTTIFAFAPIALMPGGAGEFVGTIAVGVIMAIISSFVVSLTIIPAMTGIIEGRNNANRDAKEINPPAPSNTRRWLTDGFSSRRLGNLYQGALGWLLARPWIALVFALWLPLLGFIKGGELVEQFFPPADRDQFQVTLRMSDEASLVSTEGFVKEATRILKDHPQVAHVHWFVGNSAPMFYYNLVGAEDDSPQYAQALVQLKTNEHTKSIVQTLQRSLDKALPNAQPIARMLEQGPPFPAPIEMKLFGPDVDQLRELGNEARRLLANVDNVIATRATLADGRPKLSMQLDEQEARLAGLDNLDVAAALEANLEGAQGGSILEANEELPVRVRLNDSYRRDTDGVMSIDLISRRSNDTELRSVPISALGKLALRPQVANIERENRQRVNRIFGYVTAGTLPAAALNDFQSALDANGFKLPAGYSIGWGGETGERDRAVGNLMSSVVVLMVLMVATLVMSFQSFRLAALIGAVAVAAVGLGLGNLWLFGFPFGFMAIVGTMGLIGVAINDSIVVLAAIREDPAASKGDVAAVQNVVVRASRHVMATTLTTIAGFTPLILSGGQFWPPLGITIAGGVVGATVLALVFIPTTYVLLHRRRNQQSVQSEQTYHSGTALATA